MCPVAFRFFGPERWGTVPRLMWLRIVFGWHARLKRDAIDEIVLRHLIAGADHNIAGGIKNPPIGAALAD
jgi:hypothetical protein